MLAWCPPHPNASTYEANCTSALHPRTKKPTLQVIPLHLHHSGTRGPYRWPCVERFSAMRCSMKSTASTLRAVAARAPVKRPMPAPSSTIRFSSTHPSMASTWTIARHDPLSKLVCQHLASPIHCAVYVQKLVEVCSSLWRSQAKPEAVFLLPVTRYAGYSPELQSLAQSLLLSLRSRGAASPSKPHPTPHLGTLLLVDGGGLRVQHHGFHSGRLRVLGPVLLHGLPLVLRGGAGEYGGHGPAILRGPSRAGWWLTSRGRSRRHRCYLPWMACRARSKLRLRRLWARPRGVMGGVWRRAWAGEAALGGGRSSAQANPGLNVGGRCSWAVKSLLGSRSQSRPRAPPPVQSGSHRHTQTCRRREGLPEICC